MKFMAIDGIYLYSLVEDLKKSIINILKHKKSPQVKCNAHSTVAKKTMPEKSTSYKEYVGFRSLL